MAPPLAVYQLTIKKDAKKTHLMCSFDVFVLDYYTTGRSKNQAAFEKTLWNLYPTSTHKFFSDWISFLWFATAVFHSFYKILSILPVFFFFLQSLHPHFHDSV